MTNGIVFELLCAEVLEDLRALGLGKFSIRNYYYEGMWPLIKAYRAADRVYYDSGFTAKIMDCLRKDHDNGLVADQIVMHTRKVCEFFREYTETGKITWHRIKPEPAIQLTPYFDGIISNFRKHEESTKTLGYKSLCTEEGICRKFFAYLESRECRDCCDIDLKIVNDFLIFIAPQHKASMDRVTCSLRYLCEYLLSINACSDFRAALTSRPAARKKLRPAFSSREVETVINAASENTVLSLRDTAMFSIAASVGMRAVDIVSLTLMDIDWVHHEICFTQSKTGVEMRLPLEASVGNAIANYILNERPATESQALFVRSRVPFDAMTATAAGDRLRKYMKLTDVEYVPGSGKGFHSFRRYVATSMINNEVPVDTVKEVLGHTQMGSMKAYMRISRDKLVMCALGLEGIEVSREDLL